jgi:hypothetical protein
MQVEVLPMLGLTHPSPSSWNPLRAIDSGEATYSMKLCLPDPMVMVILQSSDLMNITQRIVMRAVEKAAVINPQAFVTSILDDLMRDHG